MNYYYCERHEDLSWVKSKWELEVMTEDLMQEEILSKILDAGFDYAYKIALEYLQDFVYSNNPEDLSWEILNSWAMRPVMNDLKGCRLIKSTEEMYMFGRWELYGFMIIITDC
jgi:hypothetical protein